MDNQACKQKDNQVDNKDIDLNNNNELISYMDKLERINQKIRHMPRTLAMCHKRIDLLFTLSKTAVSAGKIPRTDIDELKNLIPASIIHLDMDEEYNKINKGNETGNRDSLLSRSERLFVTKYIALRDFRLDIESKREDLERLQKEIADKVIEQKNKAIDADFDKAKMSIE
jgi:hypothetical protein